MQINYQLKNMNNQLTNDSNEFTPEIIETIIGDQAVRMAIATQSHYWFFHMYFSQYVKYPTAQFHKEIFAITEDDSIKTAIIIAFRGCGKSTIATMSYPLWAILGRLQKKCVVIISQTQQQVKTHFSNIKRELEGNELLRNDLGPFQEESDEWGSLSLVIPKYNARIVAASSEQSIRGLRHGANRPDLIICDDVEDLPSVKTRESRDKTYNWLMGEVLPTGDKNTKVILVGNLLHEDSLLMRLKQAIEEKRFDAIFRAFPLINDKGEIQWLGMFKDMEEINKFKLQRGDEGAWQREYLLKIIAYEDQVIKREWIQYYDDLPTDDSNYQYTGTGVDLAISVKDTADCTAAVTARIFGRGDSLKIYILPNILNERLDFPSALEKIKSISSTSGKNGERTQLFVEDVAYQRSFIQQLEKDGYRAEGVPTNGQDKRARLSLISHLLSTGKVYFPTGSADIVIQQLLYFSVEKYDDLADAFTILLTMVLQKDKPSNGGIMSGRCSIWDDPVESGHWDGDEYFL